MSSNTKIFKYVEEKELTSFLRDVADAIERSGPDEYACLEEFDKIKIRIKREFGTIGLKAKFTAPVPCSVPDEDGQKPAKPSYKTLKKRMKSSFRMLVKMIHDGQVPPQEAVDSFLADSALMVTYPGYGDPHYEEYSKACAIFREAYDSGDLARMHAAVDGLIHEKGRCHANYA